MTDASNVHKMDSTHSDGEHNAPVRNATWILAAVIVIAAMVRFIGLTRIPLWYDETMHAWFCQRLTWDDLTCRHAMIEPFFCVFLWAWLKVSTADLWIRLYPALCGMAALWPAYRIGQRLGGARGAVSACLCIALSPVLVYYSRDAKMYAWVVLLELIALDQALRFTNHGRYRNLAFYALCASLLIYTHLVTPFYLAALNIAWFVLYARSWRKTLAWGIAQLAVIAAAIPYLFLEHRYVQMAGFRPFFAQKPTLNRLLITAENLITGYAAADWFRVTAVGIFTALIVIALIAARGQRRPLLFMISLAVLNIAGLYFFSLYNRNSYYVDRYLIGSAAPWLIAAAVGLSHVRRTPLRWGGWAAALFVFGIGLHDVHAYNLPVDPIKHMGLHRTRDARSAASIIRAEGQPGDVVWHAAFNMLAQTRWYLPEYPHRLIDMGHEMDAGLDIVLPDDGRDFYGNHPAQIETAWHDAKRVWLIVPEDLPALHASRQGIATWLSARAACRQETWISGRCAPIMLYLFERNAALPNPEQLSSRIILPVPEAGQPYAHPEEISLTASPEKGIAEYCNLSTQPVDVIVEQLDSDAMCTAPGFDRSLLVQSAWRLQPYRDPQTARVAFHVRVGKTWNPEDRLVQTVSMPPGTYQVWIERTLQGANYRVPAAYIKVHAGAKELDTPHEQQGPGGWSWVYAGSMQSPGGDTEIQIAAALPENVPEAMATFSRVALIRTDSITPLSPVIHTHQATLQPGASTVIALTPQRSMGRCDVCLITPEGAAAVWFPAQSIRRGE